MKKLTLLLVAFVVMSVTAFGQAVSDNAVIPVSINLNSILRLNVTSGGNIEFTVNTIEQYTSGIINTDLYDTRFTVASSVDFNVLLYAEDGTFMGVDNSANSMPLDNVGYQIEADGTGAAGINWDLETAGDDPSATTLLTATSTHQAITSLANAGAGGTAQNAFIINWELATDGVGIDVIGESGQLSLLEQSLAPDRYTTNVFLILEAQ